MRQMRVPLPYQLFMQLPLLGRDLGRRFLGEACSSPGPEATGVRHHPCRPQSFCEQARIIRVVWNQRDHSGQRLCHELKILCNREEVAVFPRLWTVDRLGLYGCCHNSMLGTRERTPRSARAAATAAFNDKVVRQTI